MENLSGVRPVHGGNLAWAAAIAGCEAVAILDFSASINPLGPPASAIAAIHSAIQQLRDYPDPSYLDLRQAIARYHHRSPEWILPGNGSAELLTWASRELAELDATYLVTPAFRDYRRSLTAFDATVVDCPMPLDLLDTATNLTATNWIDSLIPVPLSARCGLLFNNPHNPTGLLWERDRLQTLLDRFALVVVDEAFMDFLDEDAQQSVVDWVERYPNLVVLRSLTKFYSLPGLRLGYAIAHPDRLQRWRGWRDPWSVNALAAAAGIAVLADGDFQRQTLDWLPGVRSRLYDGLSLIPGLQPQPGAANFLLVRSEQSVVEIQARLLKHHRILIRDCISFPELGDRYFRVAVRTDADNQALLAGLTDILTP